MSDFSLDEGLLNKRISIYGPPSTATVNEINEPTAAGALVASVWGGLNVAGTGQRRRDLVESGRDIAEQTDIWTVRYRSDIDESATIQWNGMTWRIAAIDIRGAKEGMEIQAVRVR